MTGYSDIELIHNFRQGQPKAFKQIHALFFNRLHVFAMSLTGMKPESEEIVSDSLVKLFQKHKDFESLPNIRAFLYIAVRNSCFNYLKSRQRQEIQKKEFAKNIESDTDLEIAQIEGEMLNALYNAVKTLPDRCKTIMEMLYLEGLEAEAISAKLNISIQTVYSQKRRAVNLLKTVLAEKKMVTVLLLSTSVLCPLNWDAFLA